jgi:Ca2+-binding EF-hand superfamily protein
MEKKPFHDAAAPGERVTKAKLVAYVEQTFVRADKDGDGSLDLDELNDFLRMLCHPYAITSAGAPSDQG